MRAFGWIMVVLLGGVLAASLAPDLLGISMSYGPAQLIAFRLMVAAGCLALALACGVLAGLIRLLSTGRARRLSTLALIAVLVAAGHGGVVLSRGISDARQPVAADAQPGDVTVVSLNMLEYEADTARVVDVIATSEADVVMLPEAGDVTELVRALAVAGLTYTAFDGTAVSGGASARGTVLLVGESMGAYQGAPATVGSVRADPVDGDGPRLVAVHPIAPAIMPGSPQMQQWRTEVGEAARICSQLPGAIVAGDFNATLDHGPMRDLGGCLDAATESGSGGVGTWPAMLPRLLGAPIDHILADSSVYTVVSAAVVDVRGTDHRAVVARLRHVR